MGPVGPVGPQGAAGSDALWTVSGTTMFYNDGRIGIGTSTPDVKLEIQGGSDVSISAGGFIQFGDTFGPNLAIDTNEIMARNLFEYATLFLNSEGGTIVLGSEGNGNVGIGTATPEVKLEVHGGSDASLTGGGYAQFGAVDGFNLLMDNNEIIARNDGSASTLYLNAPGGNVRVSGGSGRLITPVIEITGGSDLSEQFTVNGAITAEPGMVVCIDADRPGELIVSTQAYDRTVAGIISGAGGVNTGMLMGQRDSIANGAFPVALTGRVYVMCDATNGAIVPGDLLTTSDHAGHAMKASDSARTHGAVIGKAMTRLDEGRGLVLVLVNLQ